ncbi:30S ribosomal protein S11 [Candidatus Peregrinibacteria bacterium]|nr:30S ribosomal protein S11 [Candidatus Peregrinibacteria bacterium]
MAQESKPEAAPGAAPAAAVTPAATPVVLKKKIKRVVPEGRAYVSAGYNNTIVTMTDANGGVLAWGSSGAAGFKGARKSTPYAAQMASQKAADAAKLYGLEKIHVTVNGIGPGREQAIRGLHLSGLEILSIVNRTPIPHNGCRRKKPRKV